MNPLPLRQTDHPFTFLYIYIYNHPFKLCLFKHLTKESPNFLPEFGETMVWLQQMKAE